MYEALQLKFQSVSVPLEVVTVLRRPSRRLQTGSAKMTESNFNFADMDNLDFHIVTLFEKIENLRREKLRERNANKLSVQGELRTFEFWKALIAETVASFVYVFLICGANAASRMGHTSPANVFLLTALTSGFAMMFLTQFFEPVSGGHVNPAVTVAMGIIKRITVLRTVMFVIAQCGGAIAGAAFLYGLYGVTISGLRDFQENLSSALGNSTDIFTSWERFGIEFVLTSLVVFSYFISNNSRLKWLGTNSIVIGATYTACTFVFMPCLNPARAFGPSFVLNKWDGHWVDWLGPLLGSICAALSFEFVFNADRTKKTKKDTEEESTSSVSSDGEYDDLDKPQPAAAYNTYRSASGMENRGNYCPNLLLEPPTRLERVESIYGGTKSLCRSPLLTRANLNRSQSVYTKSNTAINRDMLLKPGPLVPTQSLYPMRLNQQQQQQQQSHVQNQNVHNQMQQRSDQTYVTRSVVSGTSSNRSETYGTTNERTRESGYSTNERVIRRDNYATTEGTFRNANATASAESEDNNHGAARRRPESVYAMVNSQSRAQKQPTNQYPDARCVTGNSNQNRPVPNGPNRANFHMQHSPNIPY